MMRHNLPAHRWTKSSYSGGNNGHCVEYQLTEDERMAVGDSKDRTLGAFLFPRTSWTNFINSVKQGEFNL
jgi:Domain of unknown function (DUF397)